MQNGEITYSLLSSSPPGPFVVHPTLGQLRLSALLDYETTAQYRLKVRAQDGGAPPKAANLTVMVHVMDVNDNKPVFEQEEYKAEVSGVEKLRKTFISEQAFPQFFTSKRRHIVGTQISHKDYIYKLNI